MTPTAHRCRLVRKEGCRLVRWFSQALLGVCLVGSLGVAEAPAQGAGPKSALPNPAPADETIGLSPFEVRTDLDRGYAASSTLAGSRWYGRHRYALPVALKPVGNELTVRVTTVAGNYCKSLTNWNPGLRSGNAKLSYRPMGLLGPVRFLRAQ
jgi:hypothetical protein